MVEGNRIGRYIGEKIALPVILAVSLLAAWLVIDVRTVVRPSGPIELNRSGLSISMPQGNGWQSEDKWLFEDDGFTISSVLSAQTKRTLTSRGGIGRAYAHCHYLLASKEETLQEHLSTKAEELGGDTIETGQVTAGQLAFDWVKIRKESGRSGRASFEMIFGVCQLPAGRWLEIEVLQTTEQGGLAQRVFEKIVKSVRFSDNGLLQAGIEVVGEVKKAGLSAENEPASHFILTDARRRKVGFTMDARVVQADKEPAIKAASYYYVRGPVTNEEVSFFQGDNTFDKFTWRVESRSKGDGVGIEMLAESGVLKVNKLLPGGEENEYVLGDAAVPDIVLEPVLKKMLNDDRREMIIDQIRSDGTIAPMFVEKIELKVANGNSIRMEILDGRGFWQQMDFDSSKKLVKILLGQNNTYTLTPADANEIMKAFPERAYLVRDEKQLLGSVEL